MRRGIATKYRLRARHVARWTIELLGGEELMLESIEYRS